MTCSILMLLKTAQMPAAYVASSVHMDNKFLNFCVVGIYKSQ